MRNVFGATTNWNLCRKDEIGPDVNVMRITTRDFPQQRLLQVLLLRLLLLLLLSLLPYVYFELTAVSIASICKPI